MITRYFLQGLLIGLVFGVPVISDFLTAYQAIIRVVEGIPPEVGLKTTLQP